MRLRGIIIMVFVLFNVVGCGTPPPKQPQPPKQTSEYYKNKLMNATNIVVNSEAFSLGKSFSILVDNEEVATVKGELFHFGDTFTMKDPNGKFIMREKEVPTIFNLDRCAIIEDEENNVMGYIGDECLNQLFSIGWQFYFYDKDKVKIGNSSQVNLTKMFKENNIYNKDNEQIYQVDADFILIGDRYNLKVFKKDKDIPVINEIFMICIEEAIHNSKN